MHVYGVLTAALYEPLLPTMHVATRNIFFLGLSVSTRSHTYNRSFYSLLDAFLGYPVSNDCQSPLKRLNFL